MQTSGVQKFRISRKTNVQQNLRELKFIKLKPDSSLKSTFKMSFVSNIFTQLRRSITTTSTDLGKRNFKKFLL
jgi:hypothetical protein